MRKYTLIAVLAVIIIAGIFAPGCSTPPAPVPAPAPSLPSPLSPAALPSAPPTPAAPPAAATTAASTLAEAGGTIYADSCARCHGVDGQGSGRTPALVGSKAKLDKYGTAQGLFDYISKQMPLGAAGTLPKESYLRLIAFCLVQNGYVSPSTQISADQISTIKLVK